MNSQIYFWWESTRRFRERVHKWFPERIRKNISRENPQRDFANNSQKDFKIKSTTRFPKKSHKGFKIKFTTRLHKRIQKLISNYSYVLHIWISYFGSSYLHTTVWIWVVADVRKRLLIFLLGTGFIFFLMLSKFAPH